MKKIAVIGAGISGLTLANELKSVSEVMVFEKSRGVAGRMSTRYADPYCFDHGAQFFTARTLMFREFVQHYIDAGSIAEWKGPLVNLEAGKETTEFPWTEAHWVGSPNMNSFCKAISDGIKVHASCEVMPLNQAKDDDWILSDKNGVNLGRFDWVVSTAPPKQTLRLFAQHIGHVPSLEMSSMKGCYTLMIGLNRAWDKPWIAARCSNQVIQWISVNSSKPGRNQNITCVIVHSNNEWAEAHIDDEENSIKNMILKQFLLLTGIDAHKAEHVSLHRWRFAMSQNKEKIKPYLDDRLHLAAVGDWCGHSRIEDVWLNAKSFAAGLKSRIENPEVA